MQIIIRGKCFFLKFYSFEGLEASKWWGFGVIFFTYFDKRDMIVREAISEISRTLIHCRLGATCIVLNDCLFAEWIYISQSVSLVPSQLVFFALNTQTRWTLCREQVCFATFMSVWHRLSLNEFASTSASSTVYPLSFHFNVLFMFKLLSESLSLKLDFYREHNSSLSFADLVITCIHYHSKAHRSKL